MSDTAQRSAASISAPVLLGIVCVCALLVAMAGPGHRAGWWELRPAFALLRYAAYGAAAAGALSAIVGVLALLRTPHRGLRSAVVGFAIGLVAVAVPWSYARVARSVPAIHDITTDTANPPTFVAILPLRADAPNSAEYGGPEIARQQREAYPDLATARLPVPTGMAFEAARAAAVSMGWEIIAAESAQGRIEATDTTFWFGFEDDVVIRVSAEGPSSSRVDVRSVSRVGRSDVGKNAARIRAYLQTLQAQLAG
jgi:uncharacterized protein (DUF1499 family)